MHKKHLLLLSMLKSVVLLNIFVETVIIFCDTGFFQTEIFCNIMHVFIATFD